VFVCRTALRILGLDLNVQGQPMTQHGAVVANHSSWLDIFVLNASKRIYFVSKSEVAGWPGIGWLARATGTVFIERNRARAREQTRLFQDRLLAGHKLLFFPEGTSTDGRRVLPFKTTLFASFFVPDLRDDISVQPVSVAYHAPRGASERFYGWWGDMSFGAHLLAMLAAPRHGAVDVVYHTPRPVAGFPDRKALARSCEEAVRSGFDAAQSPRSSPGQWPKADAGTTSTSSPLPHSMIRQYPPCFWK
jgi:1-acyl-sn-glycerol-3-phosphate acyltransferase